MISIRIDEKKITTLLRGLGDVSKGIKVVSARAGNRTLTTTRAEMVRMIRTDYAIKAGDIRSELHIQKMYPAKLEGRIRGESSPGVPLIKFARIKRVPSTRRTKRGEYSPKRGIPVLVKKSTGKKIITSAFTARMASGHVGVFTRERKGRLPIEEKFGPTPVKLLGSKANVKRIDRFAKETLDKNLEREVNFLLIKKGLK